MARRFKRPRRVRRPPRVGPIPHRHGHPLQANGPQIMAYHYLEESIEEKEITNVEELRSLRQDANPTWVDIAGEHPMSTLKEVCDLFGIHSLTMEDISQRDQRPKVEEFDHYMYILLQRPRHLQDEGLVFEQVSIILLGSLLISFRERVPGPTSTILARMHRDRTRIRRLGSDYLAYVLIDAIVDEYLVSLELLEDRIQEVDKEVSGHPRPRIVEEIHSLRQETVILHRSVWPLREVIATLSKLDSPLLHEGIKAYLKDLQDNIYQTIELLEVYRDMIGSMLDIYLSTMSHHMNQIMKTLTIIASIFIPLTLISGIYGMNFTNMPELHWAYGYPMALGIMALVAGGMLLWFRHRRWL